jgi:hypothetical protein
MPERPVLYAYVYVMLQVRRLGDRLRVAQLAEAQLTFRMLGGAPLFD